jgi:hypothetical protein
MYHRIEFLAAIVGGLTSSAATACETFRDDGDVFSFGRYELGAHPSAFPADIRKSENCYEVAPKNYYDCLYVDRDGVEYLVYGSEIVHKEIPRLSGYSGRLIGDVRAGDTIGTVLRKFAALRDELHFWTASASRQESSKALYLSPSVCLQQSNGTSFYFHLEFDESDRLVSVSARFEGPT